MACCPLLTLEGLADLLDAASRVAPDVDPAARPMPLAALGAKVRITQDPADSITEIQQSRAGWWDR